MPFFSKAKDSVLLDKSQWNDLKAYEALVKTHASEINAPSAKQQRTPLHLAAEEGRADVTLLLLRLGADLEAQDKDGATPLLVAAANNRAKVARALLDKGAFIQTTDRNGETPLHAAVKGRHDGTVRELLRRDADYHVKDKKGKTPLDYVDEDFDMEQAFEDFGANEDPNAERDYVAIKFGIEDVLENYLGHDNLDVVVTEEMTKGLKEAVDNLATYDAFMKKVLEASNGLEPRGTMAPERFDMVDAKFKKALKVVLEQNDPELELDAMFEGLRV